jgi:CheY-like chemotaxis protein
LAPSLGVVRALQRWKGVGTLGGTLEGLRILVIEDDEDTRDVLSLGLTLYGASVTTVASATDAMAALEQRRPDVILSDIGLPDEDGLELIRKVRRLPPGRGGRVPAVAVTAFTLCDDAEEAARAGFQRHFRKPVETAALFAALGELGRQGAVERRAEERRLAQVQAMEEDRRVMPERRAS